MQAAPTLFTQNKKPMGFYLPPADRKGEMISRIEVRIVIKRLRLIMACND
jgi:hypothetical protein